MSAGNVEVPHVESQLVTEHGSSADMSHAPDGIVAAPSFAAGTPRAESPAPPWIGWALNWWFYNFAVGIASAMPNILFDYAPDVLSAVLYHDSSFVVCIVSVFAALGAGSIVMQMGLKRSQYLGLFLLMSYGIVMYVIVLIKGPGYYGLPADSEGGSGTSATPTATDKPNRDDAGVWVLALAGAAMWGSSLSIMPAAFSPLVERSAVQMVMLDPSLTLPMARASLLSSANMMIAGTGLSILGLSAGLQHLLLDGLGMTKYEMYVRFFAGLPIVVAAGILMLKFVVAPPAVGGDSKKPAGCRQEVRALLRLWKNPRIWLVGLNNMTWALQSTFKFVAFPAVAAERLGPESVLYFNVLQSGICVIFPIILTRAVKLMGVKWLMVANTGVWIFMPVLFLLTQDTLAKGWGIAVWYAGMGVAYTLRKVLVQMIVLEHFPGEQSTYAASALNIYISLVSAINFFLASWVPLVYLVIPGLVLGVLTYPAYLFAEHIKEREGHADVTAGVDQDDSGEEDRARCAEEEEEDESDENEDDDDDDDSA